MTSSRIRITGGVARGIPLSEPRGHRLRPTSSLVREALFNVLGDQVTEARVLDLYAGTGALGIEALSRGAASAVFVEAEASACQAIVQSLGRTAMGERGEVFRARLPKALSALTGLFSMILLDPPYGAEEAEETLVSLAPHLAPGGVVVYEHASRYNPPVRPEGLILTSRRVYGDSALAFYAREEAE